MIERFEFKININDIQAGANKGETILDVEVEIGRASCRERV